MTGPLVATRKTEQNRAAIDPWTGVHAGMGLAFGLLGVGFWPTAGLAVAYDVAEHAFEKTLDGQRFFKTSGPESAANIATDLAVFLGAWYLGTRWNEI